MKDTLEETTDILWIGKDISKVQREHLRTETGRTVIRKLEVEGGLEAMSSIKYPLVAIEYRVVGDFPGDTITAPSEICSHAASFINYIRKELHEYSETPILVPGYLDLQSDADDIHFFESLGNTTYVDAFNGYDQLLQAAPQKLKSS